MLEHVARRFHDAGLRFEVTRGPIVRGDARGRSIENVFQLDIADRNTNGETIRMWPGRGTQVVVQDVDKDRKQVLLNVKEPRRTFTERAYVGHGETKAQVVRQMTEGTGGRVRVARDDGEWVVLERRTDERARSLLVGMDETRYFVAQMAHPVTSIPHAHRALKPARAKQGGTARQGEWFFAPPTPEEQKVLDELLAGRPPAVQRHVAVFRPVAPPSGSPARARPLHYVGGTAHVVDELVWNGLGEQEGGLVFVRGHVKHPRHKVLKLRSWRRVVGNLETPSPAGIQWMD